MERLKIKETGSSLERLNQKHTVLLSRYNDCDSKGHYSPNPEKNRCGHCFRTLQYSDDEDDTLSQKIDDFNMGMREVSYLIS